MRRILPFLLMAAACAHAKTESAEVKAPAPVVEAPPPSPVAQPPAVPAIVSCRSDDDCTEAQLCIESRCTAIEAGTAECERGATRFAFDQSTLLPDDTEVLQRMVRCMRAQPSTRLRIEGNCDERGTTEYNVALGNRRAWASEKYLTDLGIARDRISTVSFGKERPVCADHTEACWAKNRRDDLVKAQ
jgi:peptidoglycan-associated lipoprotein